MAGYSSVPFLQQLTLMKDTMQLSRLATDAVAMWQRAKRELNNSSTSLRQGLKNLEATWDDEAGRACQLRGLQSCADIDSWPPKIDEVIRSLTALPNVINNAAQEFGRLEQRFHAATGPELLVILPGLQKQGGKLLDELAAAFQETTGTLTNAKGNPWSGPTGSSGGGGPAGSGGSSGGPGSSGGAGGPSGGAGQAASASAGGDTGGNTASAASASGEGAGADAGAIDESGAVPPDPAGDPSLQGLESAGTSPQATLPPPAPPPTATATGHATSPVMPPTSGVGAAGIPGVRLGGGPRSIPPAASPTSTEVTTASGNKPPTPPGSATSSLGAARSGAGSTGAMPPMSPMMGGLGRGGSGGAPGSGAVQPTAARRGARPTATPGLPVSLRGKADGAERSGFAPVSRPARREPEKDPTTVRHLDEEMWQVDQAPAEIRGERPKPTRPTDR